MKLAFLGKGGSGKTTLATAAVRAFLDAGRTVLAIDADHNMDLLYNLGADTDAAKLGSDPSLIKRYVGAAEDSDFASALRQAKESGVSFRLQPPDTFTSQVSVSLSPRLRLMAAGPHTDIVRSGQHCSHSLAAPLKVYLPLLQLQSDEAVIIDERAGTDPVATGILKGVDTAVIVVEPTVHSVRVACQISDELQRARVRHIFAVNKYDGQSDLLDALPFPPAITVSRSTTAAIPPVPLEQFLDQFVPA